MSPSAVPVLAVLAVSLATLAVGALGLRLSRTTSDFYVASRAVSPYWNASAIGGEYLSAASFLGVAGLLLAHGAEMLWYPVGYTAGYVTLLALVAAPLRRSGGYTLPDFAEIRLSSTAVRRTSAALVVAIGWLYLLPQFQGAGLALLTVTGMPSWVGALTVAGIVVLNVVAGGMRSVTFVQAFQYWVKLTAIAVPAFVLVLVWHARSGPDPATGPAPVADRALSVVLAQDTRLSVGAPVTVQVRGRLDGRPVDGEVQLAPGHVQVGAGTRLDLPAGGAVPVAGNVSGTDGATWASANGADRDHGLYRTYSLLVALLFGTMGLPHVLVRFFTNPDGRAARRTTLAVIALVGLFYLFPPVYGALGRLYTPDLLLTGRTDAVVLLLPGRLLPAPWSHLVTGLVTAGAFAAFLSTSSGLAVSLAGVLSQDLLRGRWRASVPGFRLAAGLAVAVPATLSLLAPRAGLADTVGLAFAVAASTFCPLLLLGIWWRRLSTTGALAGLLTGGTLATAAVLATLGRAGGQGLGTALLAQPAAWTVPTAFVTMVVVSRLTPDRVPAGLRRVMVRLHAPETLDLDREVAWRPAGRPGRASPAPPPGRRPWSRAPARRTAPR